MRLLILSSRSEEAHKRTLAAVAEEFSALGGECAYYDPSAVFDLPGMAQHPDAKVLAGLEEQIDAVRPDRILCADQMSMEAASAIRPKLSVPCYALFTDYACLSFVSRLSLDGYFIPHADLKPLFVEAGLPESRIFVTGVPISRRFDRRLDKATARNRLVIPPKRKIYLLLFGGMNRSIIEGICDEFLAQEKDDFAAYLPVRRNSDLRDDLKKKYCLDPHIHVIAYTEQQNVLMDAADVILTRPFGTQSTETSAAGVPMVHVMILPGRERLNAEFFAKRGCSVTADGVNDAIRKAMALARDSARSDKMTACQREQVVFGGARTVARLVHDGTAK